jgi:toxin ParE1/3/4
MRVEWSRRALLQLQAAVEHVAEDDPVVAWRMHDRVMERAEQLGRFPELGPEGEQPGTRVLVITETPYVMVYRVRAESIRIAAVWHTRQSRKGQR